MGVLSNRQLQMNIMCAVARYILAKVKADLEQGISGVQKALETLRHHLMNSIDGVQQRLVEQTIEPPVMPFVEKIVETLVDQTRERTLQAANTYVQRVASTVEVETPKIIKEAVRGEKSVIREKINLVADHIKNPQIPYTNKVLDLMRDVPVVMQQQMPVQRTTETSQLQFSDKVDGMPVAVQRQIPIVQTVHKTMEIPQQQCIDKVVGDPVVQVPQTQVLEKTVEGPQLQIVELIVETPETQTIQGARTSGSLGIAPVGQVTQAEIREVIEIGASIPAESASPIFVTAPVLENSPVVVGSVQPAHVAEYMALAPTVSCADNAVTHATRPLPSRREAR